MNDKTMINTMIRNLINKSLPGTSMEFINGGAILERNGNKVKFLMKKWGPTAYSPVVEDEKHLDREIIWERVKSEDIDKVLKRVLK